MKKPMAMIFKIISIVYMIRKMKSMSSAYLVIMPTSLSRARTSEFTTMTTKMILSNRESVTI